MKRIIALFLACISLTMLTACVFENREDISFDNDDAEPKEFEYVCDEGLTLKTDIEFVEVDEVSQTYELKNSDCLFSALKEEFDIFTNLKYDTETMTVEDYTDLIYYVNGFTGEKTVKDNYVYFTYEDEVDGETYFYYGLTFKGNDAFWFCNFACETDRAEDLIPKFEQWAENITVN